MSFSFLKTKSMQNYIKVYKEYYGNIPKGYHVHHLDHNHNNNEPCNLVAIPSKIHSQYHWYFNGLKYLFNDPKYLYIHTHSDETTDSIECLNKFKELYSIISEEFIKNDKILCNKYYEEYTKNCKYKIYEPILNQEVI
jgi:hypothetical protein